MDSDHLVFADDGLADDLVRRGRSAGSGWIGASGFVLAVGIGLWSTTITMWSLAIASTLLTVGLRARRRFWSEATRQVGDVAMQRARWRSVGIEPQVTRR